MMNKLKKLNAMRHKQNNLRFTLKLGDRDFGGGGSNIVP